MLLSLGDAIPLTYVSPLAATALFVRAYVYRQDDSQLSGSPFTLTHEGLGRYRVDPAPLMPNEPWLVARYEVYQDAGFTLVSTEEGAVEEKFALFSASVAVAELAPSDVLGLVDDVSGALGELDDTSQVVGITLESEELTGSVNDDEQALGVVELTTELIGLVEDC